MNCLHARMRLGGQPTATDFRNARNSRDLVVGCANLEASESVAGHVPRRMVAIAAGRIFGDHRIFVQPAFEVGTRTAGDVQCRVIRICSRRECCMKAQSEDRNPIEQRLTNSFSMIIHEKDTLNNRTFMILPSGLRSIRECISRLPSRKTAAQKAPPSGSSYAQPLSGPPHAASVFRMLYALFAVALIGLLDHHTSIAAVTNAKAEGGIGITSKAVAFRVRDAFAEARKRSAR